MTDSMKFGPEWLRNMSGDSTNPGMVSGVGNVATTLNSSGGSVGISMLQNSNAAPHMPPPRNMFPEFRYGREEMLSLFDKNCSLPEILPSFKKIYIEKVQYPLALTPSTDEEMMVAQGPAIPAIRPTWLQRSPVGFSSSPRGTGRGGSVDRGRMRGKSVYHPMYPRPPAMFDDDLRSAALKAERGWSERNGTSDSLGGGVGGVSLGTEWNGTPASSPRKEFSNHPRNMENWRRNRSDDPTIVETATGSSVSSNDGWRGSSTTSFGSTHRWGRSTSWRDDEVTPANASESGYGAPSTNGIIMQRSYSTVATTVTERGGYSNNNNLAKGPMVVANYGAGRGIGAMVSGGTTTSTRNTQWVGGPASGGGGIGGSEMDDNLPEWAMENPSDSGGTFDASGAFHGSIDEDDGSGSNKEQRHENAHRKKSTSSSEGSANGSDHDKVDERTTSEDSAVSSSESSSELIEVKQQSCLIGDGKSKEHDQQSPLQGEFQNEQQTKIKKSPDGVVEHVAKVAGLSESQLLAAHGTDDSATPASYFSNEGATLQHAKAVHNQQHLHSATDYSDHMKEVADDMVQKLIMDDDSVSISVANISSNNSNCPETKPNSTGSTAGETNMRAPNAFVSPVVQAILKQTQQQQQNAMSVSPPLPSMSVAHKPIPLFGGGVVVDHATMQQHHHMQHQQMALNAAAANATAGLPHSMNPAGATDLWYYRDPQSKVQGPFTAIEMTEWYRAGYFNENLYVRRVCDKRFRALGDLIKLCHGNMPFTHSQLIPMGLDDMHIASSPAMAQMCDKPSPSIVDDFGLKQQHNEQREDLKGNVTAAADTLSSAVKNMISSVDMSHILNVHFQMLQEQYLRRQEMMVNAELQKNEGFQRLPPAERETFVRQKVQLLGLPEYLTSLAGLSNSLATLNPAAGNQLYDAITECSKKDHIFAGSQPQQQRPQQNTVNPFLDADDFIMNAQQQQLQQQRHQQQQQQQHQQQHQQQQQQLQSQFPNAPYGSVLGPCNENGDNSKISRSGNDNMNCNELLGNFNLRMFLRGGNAETQQKPQADYMGVGANSNPNFLTEQQILEAAAPSQSPMMQMWMPQLSVPINQVQPQPHLLVGQQTHQQQPQNQWVGGGALVGMPNVVMPTTQMGVGSMGPPKVLWDVAALDHSQQQQHQQQMLERKVFKYDEQKDQHLFDRTPAPKEQLPLQKHQQQRKEVDNLIENQTQLASSNPQQQLETVATIATQQLPVALAVITRQGKEAHETTEKHQQLQQMANGPSKRNSNSISVNNNGKQQHQHQMIVSAKLKEDVSGRKIEDERRREQVEEKRRQKEERKRQQLEDEKRRQQQIEEEKRRQLLEEKDRQQQIQAQRRKALMAGTVSSTTAVSSSSVGINNTSGGAAVSPKSGKMQLQSSVAPWSTQTTAAASKSGPCLAEIQKAERRERRADQQRQLELLEKQMRANAAAAEANDSILKWNASPVPVKSFAEIQAEEAKRLASDQHEMQRRKEQEQQQTVLSNASLGVLAGIGGGGSISGPNNLSAIWGNNKVWGSNSAPGFWDETYNTTAATIVANITNNKQSLPQQHKAPSGGGQLIVGSATTRNLRKSQSVTVMQSAVAAGGTATAMKNSNVKPSNQQLQSHISVAHTKQSGKLPQQQQLNKSDNDKKGAAKVSSNNGTSNGSNTAANKKDDFENEFTGWCTKSLNSMSTKVDVPTFVTFLQDLESPYEVKDYIRMYLGESKEYTEFAKQFLERRSKYKNLQRAQNAHNDDMCKPAPAITPSGNDNSDKQSKQKKVKKNKMTKLDARILGFSVTAAEGRINVGDRDYADAP